MKSVNVREQVAAALRYLCTDLPTRTLGTEGNRCATIYVEDQLATSGWRTQRQEFACLDWVDSGASLIAGQESYVVDTGPYSPPCAVAGPLVACSSVEELEDAPDLAGCILLLHGPVAAEQLMPRNFPFYNPVEHRARLRRRGSETSRGCHRGDRAEPGSRRWNLPVSAL